MKSTEFMRLREGFKEWLGIMGYAEHSIAHMPQRVGEFFVFLEDRDLCSLKEVQRQDLWQFYEQLKRKKSRLTGELLKGSTLNGINRVLRLFAHYVEETGQGRLLVDIPYEPREHKPREILTREEARMLYQGCGEDTVGIRDRAMLSIYYGCGLRSKEGRYLMMEDVLLDRRLLHVREAKTRQERYVPFLKSQRDDFSLYLKQCRPHLAGDHSSGWFLLNNRGGQVSADFLLSRLKVLLKESGIDKRIGLHSLRHSIATHLLQSGMRIEDIAVFLGHKNIDSTQRYTHIVQESE